MNRYQSTVLCKTQCKLYSLSRNEMLPVFEGDPAALRTMQNTARKKENMKTKFQQIAFEIKNAVHLEKSLSARRLSVSSIHPETRISVENLQVEATVEDKTMETIQAQLDVLLSRVSGPNMCMVCTIRPRMVVLLNCRHLATCSFCSSRLTKCPKCETAILSTLTLNES